MLAIVTNSCNLHPAFPAFEMATNLYLKYEIKTYFFMDNADRHVIQVMTDG